MAPLLSALDQDVRQALRNLARRPGVAVAVFGTLALSIGANVAVFSIVNALLLRPLPFGERSDRVVNLYSTHAQQPEDWSWGDSEVSYSDLLDLRQASAFEGLGGYLGRSLTLSQDGAAERVRGGSVTPDLFPLLGVAPAAGRLFREDEGAAPGLERVVLLTHGLWQRRYGGRADIVGRSIQVNGLPRTVVGVLPSGFRFPERDDLYLPLRWLDAPRDARGINAVGLLRRGISLAQAQEEASTVAARLARDYDATNRGFGVRLLPFRDAQVNRGARFLSATLMAAVGLVLLIACANLANLMLVQATGRRREMAVRSALGAGEGRLVRLVLVETAVVALGGTLAGLLAAEWLLDSLRGSFPEDLPYWMTFDFDWRIALFAVGLTAVTILAVGLLPLPAPRGRSWSPTSRRRQGHAAQGPAAPARALVVAQVAVCLALLVGASMVVRGFLTLQTSDLGFDHRRLLSMRVYLAGDQFDPPDARARAIDEIAEVLSAMEGVEVAAATTSIPGDDGGDLVRVVADEVAGIDDGIGVQTIGVSAGIFDTLGVPLLAGRR
ncbi:MAG: ABC transporter permease [Vicinamibacterales bacterium]